MIFYECVPDKACFWLNINMRLLAVSRSFLLNKDTCNRKIVSLSTNKPREIVLDLFMYHLWAKHLGGGGYIKKILCSSFILNPVFCVINRSTWIVAVLSAARCMVLKSIKSLFYFIWFQQMFYEKKIGFGLLFL